jgi:hypothetical protein
VEANIAQELLDAVAAEIREHVPGGLRRPERFGDARAPGRVTPPEIHPRRGLLCF